MNMLKVIIKKILGRIIFVSGLHRLLLNKRAVIIAFHSVNKESTASDINCTPELFRDYCEFFKRYFRVISLEELLKRMRNGDDIGGCLVITFDDGYEDNARIAAPILFGMNLPATFFVTSGFIGSQTIADWDAKIDIKSEWMTWDDVIEDRKSVV